MTLGELWDELWCHDWYWQMTDDPRVSARGMSNERRIRALAESLGPAGVEMLTGFRAHYTLVEDPFAFLPTLPPRPSS